MLPDYQSLMKPVLLAAQDGEVRIGNVVEQISIELNLTDEEKNELLASGKQTVFSNRVHWARTYLVKSGLLEATRRGHIAITERGKKALAENVNIDVDYLKLFEEFNEFHNSSKASDVKQKIIEPENSHLSVTPDEALRIAYKDINKALENDILTKVRTVDPYFFEQIIVDLLTAMGYGGSKEDAGRALGKSGDNGVDGVIDQDPLGVDQIYMQAKRYDKGNNISSSHIRDFFGALNLKRANKGIFITSSDFTQDAINTAENLGNRIVLINGEELSKLMLKYSIGSREEETLFVRKIDEEYFETPI